MAFPFTIKYSKQIQRKVSISDNVKSMHYIKNFITQKNGEDITIDENELTFKAGFLKTAFNWHILGPIEKGKFTIIDNENGSVLRYEFFMYRLFAIAAIMSIGMGIVSQPWFGVTCFIWIGGMNWIIAIVRHRSMLGEIVTGIDNDQINSQ